MGNKEHTRYNEAKREHHTGAPDLGLQSWVFNEIMDRMNTNIYVTDMDTDEILFMNKTMKHAFGLKHPEGKVCWQVLQNGMGARCSFCPVASLKGQPESDVSYIWEEHNTLTGRIYENYDSVMKWMDGRLVHFQHSVDITENRRLSHEASTDELTGLLNRRAGKAALAQALERCRQEGQYGSVCMFDINDLKEINDTYGHAAGDHLLLTVAQTVQDCLCGQDLFFRLSGDEFILFFAHKREHQAAHCLEQALARLRALDLYACPNREREFCFGIVEIGADTLLTLSDLLREVDEKLYEQKRSRHIRKAEMMLQQSQPVAATEAAFEYDTGRLYDALVRSTDDYIYVCNMKTGVFHYPQAMVDEFELPGQVIANAAAVWGARVHEHDKTAFLEANQEITDGRSDSHNVEYRAKNRHGEWVWLRCRGHLQRDEQGNPTLFAGMITNLGKRNKIDPLTGLFNKYEFENELIRLMDQDQGSGALTVMMFGIDDLKRINQLHDRVFGDEVIRIMSQKIQSLLPANANVYKLDGDEFGVLIRGGDERIANTFFAAVKQAVNVQQSFDDNKFFCTFSCGCTYHTRREEKYLDLIKYANYALDYAKKQGKNQMQFFSREILEHMERSLELTEMMRASILADYQGFAIYFQPIFDRERNLCGAEALMRWQCEKYGVISPDEFIGLLEQSGMILIMGKWIFQNAVYSCQRFLAQYPDFLMGINISYLQLEDPAFLPFVRQLIEQTGIDPAHLILELTESYLAANLERLSGLLAELRQIGIRIAMDDFGTGYSSLGVLKQAPIDIVKIDRTFVKGIRQSAFDYSFIKLVVELCHIVGMEVCLEGLETEAEYHITHPMEINFLQGFLLGRPVPEAQFQQRFLAREQGL